MPNYNPIGVSNSMAGTDHAANAEAVFNTQLAEADDDSQLEADSDLNSREDVQPANNSGPSEDEDDAEEPQGVYSTFAKLTLSY